MPKRQPSSDYAAHRENMRQRQAAKTAAGRDIGDIPPVVNPTRRAEAEGSFKAFCEAYFPGSFYLGWSRDHLRVIEKIELAVRGGELFAFAMPRASGKTELSEKACLWAMLTGRRRFIALIGSDKGHATQLLNSIKVELSANDLLAEDFPEACYPIARLEGIANRCAGQTFHGKPTRIQWTDEAIALPIIAGSAASGAVVRVAGITGGIRGMKHKSADGQSLRPDLVILDDPQTDESARSPSQCATREALLAGAILGLAGPGKKIAGFMPCTVIRAGDMADRILDRDKHPQWQGERMKMVYAWPKRMDLWEKYAQIRRDSMKAGRNGAESLAFYAANRQAMDDGADLAWPERFNTDEASALQHAMNLRFQDREGAEAAFMAEYQNEPPKDQAALQSKLTPDQIAGKINGHERGVVPAGRDRLTAFIDVQDGLLFYVVVAWSADFSGDVLTYGVYPDQQRLYFTKRDSKRRFHDGKQPGGLEGAIYAALDGLCAHLLGREWPRTNGPAARVERLLIDANWGMSTDSVYRFCRSCRWPTVVGPSHGKGITASSKPMGQWPDKPGDRKGLNWRMPVATKREVRHVLFDSNFWKSFVHERIATPTGGRGSLCLYGKEPGDHRLLADHILAEYTVRTEGRGRVVDEWKPRPDHPDNDWLDCLVGASVAASMLGCSLFDQDQAKPRRRVSFAELQARARRHSA